jgi:hypothetical protein
MTKGGERSVLLFDFLAPVLFVYLFMSTIPFSLASAFYGASDGPAATAMTVLGVLGLLVLWLIVRLVQDHYDRLHITEEVERNGGEVVRIEWSPMAAGLQSDRAASLGRIYEVTWRPQKGESVTAVCRTGLLAGVDWLHGPAPSGQRAPEAFACLSCGATIPKKRNRCRKCGWSYDQR